jgi:hypothetical protein
MSRSEDLKVSKSQDFKISGHQRWNPVNNGNDVTSCRRDFRHATSTRSFCRSPKICLHPISNHQHFTFSVDRPFKRNMKSACAKSVPGFRLEAKAKENEH